jgi:hypothetical protein
MERMRVEACAHALGKDIGYFMNRFSMPPPITLTLLT